MSDVTQSPQHSGIPETSGSWPANKLSSFGENSPRSILKGPKTPDLLNLAEGNRSQVEQYDDLLGRRVSFASATRVRVYGKNETPNSPSHRTLNQRLSASSPQDDNTGPDNSLLHSPSNRSDNALLSRLSGSPMDRRKRRRDMFGSPPSQRTAKQPSVVYPEYRVRGMRKLEDDDDDDDGGPRHDPYFMQALSQSAQGEQQGRKRLFDDEGDTTGTAKAAKAAKAAAAAAAESLANNRSESSKSSGGMNADQRLAGSQSTQHSSIPTFYDTTTIIPPVGSPNSKTARRLSIGSYIDDNTDAMQITLPQPVVGNRLEGSPIADTTDLAYDTTRDITHGAEPRSTIHDSTQPSQETQRFNEGNTFHVLSPNRPSSFAFPSQSPSQKDSQDLPPSSSQLHSANNTLYDDNAPSNHPFSTSSPTRPPLRSPSRSKPFNSNSSAKSPRIGMSVLESMDASPILPLRSPLGVRSGRQQAQHQSPPGLFSPKRSFYLHDQAQAHSPLINSNNANPPRHFPKSPLRHEGLLDRNLTDHSIGSDYGDRMESMHGSENFNIFEEELPELYDSYIADPPSPKSKTLSHFLDICGFPSKATTTRKPKQVLHTNHAPASFDEQASAAASTFLELDAYEKLVEKTEDLIKDLTAKLQQMDEDLSQNNPQVFAEYDSATPAMITDMENRFTELRKLAYTETEQQWYNEHISVMESLLDVFRNQMTGQHKDQELLKQKTDYLTKHLPFVLKKRQDVAKDLEEARKRLQTYEQLDLTLLDRWERDIRDQEAVIAKSLKDAQKIEEKEEKVSKELALLAEKKAELQLAIAQAEETKNAHTYVSELDVLQAKDTYDTCTVLCAWKLENHTDDTLQFIVHDDLDVLLDTNKLKNRDVDAVFIRMLESRDYHYGPFAELVHGLQTTAKGLWTKDKVLQEVAIYWNRVRMIRNEITAVKRRFWIEMEALTQDPLSDPDLRGFRCTITLFSFTLKIKFLVSFEIRAQQVMEYPQSIDLSTLVVKFVYGDT
ncbi:hypothetical protein, partial, partial [Absidia glauca]